jgi:hypothetical protein
MRRAANLGLKWAFFACISRITLQPDAGAAWAALAQVVEHIIRNDGVAGSSPASGTISLVDPDT